MTKSIWTTDHKELIERLRREQCSNPMDAIEAADALERAQEEIAELRASQDKWYGMWFRAQEEIEWMRTDENRLRHLATEPFCDIYADIDLHEEAMINASALGRDEPNADDYLAALRTAIDAAMAMRSSIHRKRGAQT